MNSSHTAIKRIVKGRGWIAEDGFTLVEVLVSSAIFAGVFLIVLTLFVQATSNLSGEKVLIATSLATSRMEDVLAQSAYEDGAQKVNSNGQDWTVLTECHNGESGINTIRIVVYRSSGDDPLIELTTQVFDANGLNTWEQ